jgi:ribose transport system substrate-binding protein
MNRKFAFVCICLSLMLVFTSAVHAAAQFTIGLSIPSQDDGFFVNLVKGAQTAADTAKAELKVVAADYDTTAEAAQIQTLIDDAVSLILIYPVDFTADTLTAPIKAANEANIPVFLLGGDINHGDADLQIASILSPASDEVGAQAGSYFCGSVDPSKTVLVLSGVSAADSVETTMAEATVTPMATDQNPKVMALTGVIDSLTSTMASTCAKVPVQVESSTSFDNADSLAYFENQVKNHTDIGAVFASNTALINDLLDAVLSDDLRGIDFVTTDLSADTVGALERGDIARIIAPEPTAMGEMAIEKALDLLGGNTVESNLSLELALVDTNSAIDYRYSCGDGCP